MSAGQFECNVKQQKHRLMEDLVELVIKASEELQTLPGDFEVDLELHWLPSHGASVPHDDRVRLHDYVDQIAAHCRKDREDLFQVDRGVLTPEPGVFASLKSPLLVPPPGFLALFHPAQQDLSIAGATDGISSVVDSVLLGRLQQLEEARQAPRLVQREHDVARKETLLDAREDRLAEGRQDLKDEKNAFSQAKNDLADERKALDDGRKALGEGRKALAEEKEVLAQKGKEQRETEQGLMDRERAVKKAEEALEAHRLQMEAVHSREMTSREMQVASREMQVAAREEQLRICEGEAQDRLYVFPLSPMFQQLTTSL